MQLSIGNFRLHVLDMIRQYPLLWDHAAEFFYALTRLSVCRRDSNFDVVSDPNTTLGDLDARSVVWIDCTLQGAEDELDLSQRGSLLSWMLLWQFRYLMNKRIDEILGFEDMCLLFGGRGRYLNRVDPQDKSRMTQTICEIDVVFRVPTNLTSCCVKLSFSKYPHIEFTPGKRYLARLKRCPFSQPSGWNTSGWPSRFTAEPEIRYDLVHACDHVVVQAESWVPHDCAGSSVETDGTNSLRYILSTMGDRWAAQRVFLPIEWIEWDVTF